MTNRSFQQRFLVILVLLLLTVMLPVWAQPEEPVDEPPASETVEVTPEVTPLIAPGPRERPAPASTYTVDGITMEFYFEQVQQGRVALMRVLGDDITGARLRFLNQLTDFFADDDGSFYGLLVVGIDQAPNRTYSFDVYVWHATGTRSTISGQVEVALGGFVRQDFNLPAERAYLADPQIERAEFARLDAVFEGFTEEKLWDDEGFVYPINSAITSPFGAFRILNETMPTRHTGWDLRAAVGTPVMAMAAGEVAFAGLLDVRGNHIVIDHGYGIYSGYSHLSQIHVTRGQTVSAGQIIGVSGNTGRSSGPHLHWEVTVNGHWVDAVDFMQMWLP